VFEKGEKYIFFLPSEFKLKAKLICAKRDISLAKFVRESVEKHIEYYKQFLIELKGGK